MSDTTPSLPSSKRRLSTESSTQRSTKQKTFDLSHLDPSEDRLTTDDHEHLDKAAHSSIDEVLSLTGQPAPTVIDILREVVITSDGLDQAYQDAVHCKALFRDETYGPQLRDMLQLAWSEKSFKSIRNLRHLQKAGIIDKKSPLFSGENYKDYKHAVETSWTRPYEGNTNELLLQTINDMNATRGRLAFSNYLPIVQSSGTGKSRAVHEMSRLVFTIPFNVRSDAENAGLAYPDSDDKLAKYLKLGGTDQISYDEAKLRYLKFFFSLFDVSIARLDERVRLTPNRLFTSHEDLAEHWSKCFEDKDWRTAFFNEVIAKDKEQQKDVTKSDFESSLDKAAEKAATKFVELKGMQDSIVSGGVPKSEAVRLVLCFDEAHILHDTIVSPERTLYQALCSAANELVALPLFVVFLSTVSKLSAFAPSADLHTSARKLADDKSGLQAPFTELPFDIRARNETPIRSNRFNLNDINTIDFMCQFGRPLWKSLAKSFPARSKDQNISRLARGKLAGQNLETDLSSDAVLAALAVRLCLDFKSSGLGPVKEAQLVTSHMRIAFSVPAHRQFMKSGYPSEPVLAEAAAQLMRTAYKENHRPVEILAKLLNQDIVHKGERGELVARLILTQAYDKAVLAGKENLKEVKFSAGVSLESFIRALFGDEKAEMILESKPDNVPDGVTFREAFKTAIVRFTHFQRAGDDTAASTSAAYAAFMRGMSFQCFSNQKEIDIVIPVLLRDEKLGEWVMTAILIQIKDRTARVPRAQLRINEKRVGFFPRGENDECRRRPYIALHMELGVTSSRRSTSHDQPEDSSRVGTPKATTPSTPPKGKKAAKVFPDTPSKFEISQPGRNKYSTATHPRYSIFVAGCSGSVYAVVDNKQAYASLLSSQTVLQEHPRQNKGSLSAVRRLKPLWEWGPDCFDWIDERSLSGYDGIGEELEEGLTTGDQIADDDDDDDDNDNDNDMFAD